MENVTISIIARMKSDFPTKFGIPRQSGLVEELRSTIIFEPEFRNPDALRGIEGYSHLWLIWQFSEAVRTEWSPTVRPPRLGGNTRMGVFATRSPFRPNSLGLSSVKLLGVVSYIYFFQIFNGYVPPVSVSTFSGISHPTQTVVV